MSGELIKIYTSESIPKLKYLIYIHNNILTKLYDDISDYLEKLKIEYSMNKKTSRANARIKFGSLNDYMMFKLYFMEAIQKAYVLTPQTELQNDFKDYYSEDEIPDKIIYAKSNKIKPTKVKCDFLDINYYPKDKIDMITPEQIELADKKQKIKQEKKQKIKDDAITHIKILFERVYELSIEELSKSDKQQKLEDLLQTTKNKKINGVELFKKFRQLLIFSYNPEKSIEFVICMKSKLLPPYVGFDDYINYIDFHLFRKYFPDVYVTQLYFITNTYAYIKENLKQYYADELKNGQKLDFISLL